MSQPKPENRQTIRAFVAIDIPDKQQGQIALLQNCLKHLPGQISWVKPQNMHLTLKFMGEFPASLVEAASQALQGMGVIPFELGFAQQIGFFPSEMRPRVIWLGLESAGELARLQRTVEERLCHLGLPPEDKAFKPHLTLGRLRQAFKGNLAANLKGLQLPQVEGFRVSEIKFIRSELRPQGPVYTELGSVAFICGA